MRVFTFSSFSFCCFSRSFFGSYEYVEDESRVTSATGLVDVLDVEEKVVDDCPGMLIIVERPCINLRNSKRQ